MKTFPLDEAAFARAGLAFVRTGDRIAFTLPDLADPVEVLLVSGALQFVPERSATHQRLLRMLEAGGS